MAPLRISTFRSCQPQARENKEISEILHSPSPAESGGNAGMRPAGEKRNPAHAPSARTARRRRGQRRRWRGPRRGRIRAAGRRRRRRWARGGFRGAPRSRPRSPARGGWADDRATGSQLSDSVAIREGEGEGERGGGARGGQRGHLEGPAGDGGLGAGHRDAPIGVLCKLALPPRRPHA
jgi:hypothetical protein